MYFCSGAQNDKKIRLLLYHRKKLIKAFGIVSIFLGYQDMYHQHAHNEILSYGAAIFTTN